MALFGAQSVKAQNQKIGFFDLSRVYDSIPQVDTVNIALAAYNQQLQYELSMAQKEVSKYYKKYETAAQKYQSAPTEANQQAVEHLQITVETMSKDYEQNQQAAQQMMQYKQAELMQPLSDYIEGLVKTIAEKKGFNYILSSNPVNLHYYSTKKDDITDDILKIMVEKAPKVKAAPAMTLPK